MVNQKQIKNKGKIQLSKYFQKFENGEFVSIVKDLSIHSNFPLRMQGRTGTVESKRGKSYVIKMKDSNATKRYIVAPIHLQKIKVIAK